MTRDEIVAAYAEGKSCRKIADESGSYRDGVRDILVKEGVKLRPTGPYRIHTLNEYAFSTHSEEANYWAGFLFADGCLVRRRAGDKRSLLSVKLQAGDVGHLEKLSSFLGSSRPVATRLRTGAASRYGGGSYAHLQISSDKIARDLQSWGMSGTSLCHVATPELSSSRDFWRGVVDGDGSVFFSKGIPFVWLCGSMPLLTQYSDWVRTVCPGIRATVRPQKSIHQMSIGGRYAPVIVEALYRDARISLDRKRVVAERIMTWQRHLSPL